jgi:hypothetical protein
VEVEVGAEVEVEVEAAMPVDVGADVGAARTVRPFTALPKAEPYWVWPSGRDTLSAGMAPPIKGLKISVASVPILHALKPWEEAPRRRGGG